MPARLWGPLMACCGPDDGADNGIAGAFAAGRCGVLPVRSGGFAVVILPARSLSPRIGAFATGRKFVWLSKCLPGKLPVELPGKSPGVSLWRALLVYLSDGMLARCSVGFAEVMRESGMAPELAIGAAAGQRRLMRRQRLDSMFDVVAASRITTVTAPAGFAKTTTLRSWAKAFAGSGRRLVWVAGRDLPPGHADLETVLHRASLQRLSLHQTVGLAADQTAPAGGDSLFSRIGDASDAVLLVDDCEWLAPSVRAELEALAVTAPDGVTMILASRQRPVVPVARL